MGRVGETSDEFDAFTLRELRYFIAVVEEGQLSAAARRLHVAQPALSYAIAKLERHLGVKLLERHARGMTPTSAGRALLDHARVTAGAADALAVAARQWSIVKTTELVVGVLPMSLVAVEPLLAALNPQLPSLDVRLQQLDFVTQRSLLRSGETDVEVAIPVPTSDEFMVIPFATVARAAFVSTNHEQISSEQVFGEVLCGYHRDVPDDWLASLWLGAPPRDELRVSQHKARTPEEVWLAVAGGSAVAVGPAFLSGATRLPGVVALPVADVEPIAIGLIHRHGDKRESVQAAADAARSLAMLSL